MNKHGYFLGKRIVVRGVTGSGKSTLARALGEALGLKVIELDSINWQRPGWQALPTEEFKSQLREALDAASQGWVVDGSYTAASGIVLEQADTLVWIHLPFRVTFYRVVIRTFGRARRREVLWGVQRESLRMQFFSKDSLFLWAIKNHRPNARRLRQTIRENPHLQAYELRSQSEVAALLEAARRESVM